jgi:1,4-alpha-glucan branching enzyme
MSAKDNTKADQQTTRKSEAKPAKPEKTAHKTPGGKTAPKPGEKASERKENTRKKPDIIPSGGDQSGDFISDYDIHLFKEGKHFSLYERLGSHLITRNGQEGVFLQSGLPMPGKFR